MDYFFARVSAALGDAGGRHISWPSPIRARSLQKTAEDSGFRRVFFGVPEHRRPLFGAVEIRLGAAGGERS